MFLIIDDDSRVLAIGADNRMAPADDVHKRLELLPKEWQAIQDAEAEAVAAKARYDAAIDAYNAAASTLQTEFQRVDAVATLNGESVYYNEEKAEFYTHIKPLTPDEQHLATVAARVKAAAAKNPALADILELLGVKV